MQEPFLPQPNYASQEIFFGTNGPATTAAAAPTEAPPVTEAAHDHRGDDDDRGDHHHDRGGTPRRSRRPRTTRAAARACLFVILAPWWSRSVRRLLPHEEEAGRRVLEDPSPRQTLTRVSSARRLSAVGVRARHGAGSASSAEQICQGRPSTRFVPLEICRFTDRDGWIVAVTGPSPSAAGSVHVGLVDRAVERPLAGRRPQREVGRQVGDRRARRRWHDGVAATTHMRFSAARSTTPSAVSHGSWASIGTASTSTDASAASRATSGWTRSSPTTTASRPQARSTVTTSSPSSVDHGCRGHCVQLGLARRSRRCGRSRPRRGSLRRRTEVTTTDVGAARAPSCDDVDLRPTVTASSGSTISWAPSATTVARSSIDVTAAAPS